MTAPALEQLQPFLQRIAYDLVRCKADAEDIVQDTLLRWMNVQNDRVKDAKAYLARMVTNACMDHLAQRGRQLAASWEELENSDLVRRFREFQLPSVDLEAQLSAVLENIHHRLEPLERAVFVMREAFSMDYDTISATFDRKKEHCRQLLSRAHRKLTGHSSDNTALSAESVGWHDAFHKACSAGDLSMLIRQFQSDIRQDEEKN